MSWNRAFYRCEFYLHSAFGHHDVALMKADEDFPADTVALSYFYFLLLVFSIADFQINEVNTLFFCQCCFRY